MQFLISASHLIAAILMIVSPSAWAGFHCVDRSRPASPEKREIALERQGDHYRFTYQYFKSSPTEPDRAFQVDNIECVISEEDSALVRCQKLGKGDGPVKVRLFSLVTSYVRRQYVAPQVPEQTVQIATFAVNIQGDEVDPLGSATGIKQEYRLSQCVRRN